MNRTWTSVLLALAFALPARADVITLDDGHKIEGEVVRQTEEEVEVRLPNGSTTFPRSRILKIEKKLSASAELAQRRAALDPKDAAGRVALARFAHEKRFPREKVVELALEAFRIDPGIDGAAELLSALDYRFERGFWIEPEKWYPKNGYQRDKGRWLVVEELALREAVASVARARLAVTQAEEHLRTVEGMIAAFPEEEAAAKKKVEDVKTEVAALATQRSNAQAVLTAREADLQAAVDRTLIARRDLVVLQQLTVPQDPTARQAHVARLAAAELIFNQSALAESRARQACSAQRKVVDDLLAAEQEAPELIRRAEAMVANVQARAKLAREELPRRRQVVRDAQALVEQALRVERNAERALEARVRHEQGAAEDRKRALAEYVKNAAKK